MPLTIFGRSIGVGSPPASSYNPPGTGSGLGRPTLIGGNSTATRVKPSSNTPGGAKTQSVGRAGYTGPTATNAGSDVTVAITGTQNLGYQLTQPLPADGDYVAMIVNVSVTASSQTITTDILNALGTWQLIAPDGSIISFQPNPDWYLFSQRLSEYGIVATVTGTTVTTTTQTVSASYYVPLNLPASGGPYTLIAPLAATFPGGAATFTVSLQIAFKLGTAPNRTRYLFTSLPFTPGNNGANDFSPLSPVQDVYLDELFLTGLGASYTAAINYLQIQSEGSTVATNIYVGDIVARQAIALTTAVPSGYLYPLLAMNTQVKLGRLGHWWFYWGGTAPTTARVGMLWHD